MNHPPPTLHVHRDIPAAVRRALVSLGDSPDGIRQALAAAGVRGQRGDACHCLLARFLLAQLGLNTGSVQVTSDTVHVRAGNVWHETALPPVCVQAVILFDGNAWPELVETPVDD